MSQQLGSHQSLQAKLCEEAAHTHQQKATPSLCPNSSVSLCCTGLPVRRPTTALRSAWLPEACGASSASPSVMCCPAWLPQAHPTVCPICCNIAIVLYHERRPACLCSRPAEVHNFIFAAPVLQGG